MDLALLLVEGLISSRAGEFAATGANRAAAHRLPTKGRVELQVSNRGVCRCTARGAALGEVLRHACILKSILKTLVTLLHRHYGALLSVHKPFEAELLLPGNGSIR